MNQKIKTMNVNIEIGKEVEQNNEMSVSEEEIKILTDRIAQHCVGYTGAEMKMIIKKAITYYYHDNKDKINNGDEKKENKKAKEKENNNNNENNDNNEITDMNENFKIHKNINKYQQKLKFEYFEKAILDVKRSVTNLDLKEFENWAKEKN